MIPECGAIWLGNRVGYRVWAPLVEQVTVVLEDNGGTAIRSVALAKDDSGYHAGIDPEGRPGDRYRYRLDARGPFPDPVSRAQAESVHGASLVVDPAFPWSDAPWQRPAFRDLVIYELHVGTFTPAGTFRSAIERLPDLRELGVNAIELLPIADFPGNRNWGYDGVSLYAPARCYGSPRDLRDLVNAAHAHGIAVILDVVYNHLGPDGNYLAEFSPAYFTSRHHTPWGKALNFDGPNSRPVRDFFIGNIRYWMADFHIDGFRLDATHELPDDSSPHLLAEIAETVHASGGYVIAEDPRNEARLLEAPNQGGYGLDAVWADDFHHSVRVSQTRENSAYYVDFAGTPSEVLTALREGWIYTGQYFSSLKINRGTPGGHLPPATFVHCISNHDQIGNRAMGDRLNHVISPAAYRALSTLLCFTPYTPMLFMGQEWAASTPFQFFTDHSDELGRAITQGRRREFAGFPEFSDPQNRKRIPDPQAATTFERSKLDWTEAKDSPIRLLYQTALRLRQELSWLRPKNREDYQVVNLTGGASAIRFGAPELLGAVVFDLFANHSFDPSSEPNLALPKGKQWNCRFSSQESRFGGHRDQLISPFDFSEPEVWLFEVV